MTKSPIRVSHDCALLPGPAGYVVYLGARGRAFRITAHVGQWLLRGADQEDRSVSDADRNTLLELGVLTAARSGTLLPINAFAPAGAVGWVILAVLLVTGVASWAVVSTAAVRVVGSTVSALRDWTTWAMVPFVTILLTLWHEWGHVLVLRTLGGRAGRIHLRFGWPWAVTEVGPFQDVLPAWQQALLVAGGILVEFVLLGLTLLYIMASGAGPIVSGVAVTNVVYLVFNLFPTPWSDGGQLVLLAFRGVLSLVRRRGA